MEPKGFEILSPDGDKGLFIAAASSGFVAGPLSGPWTNDRITVGLQPEGNLKLVHRSIGASELWRHDPVSLQAEVESFLANNISEVDWKELSGPQTYLFSVYRRGILLSAIFKLLEAPSMFLMWHLVVSSDARGKEFVFEQRKVEHFAKSLQRFPLPSILRFVARVPPKAWLPIGQRVFRFFLMDPRNHERVVHDICFLVSPNRVGLVFAGKGERPAFLPVEAVTEAYHRIEMSLPFGKFSEFTDIMKPGVRFRVQ